MSLEGRLLGNRYEIIEKIGNGGMATVYKAKCHVLNRFVAVKILRDEFTTDDEFIKRFNIEAQAVASLTHPNIVSVYDVGHEGNLYYIVMELVKGKTLKEIIVEDGTLGWKWSVKVAMQIASALETAHRNNIIHRDIKPHNIIITEEGIAKVTDFGIAKAVSNSTITAFGTTIGSVHYFSPEHARGGYTDAKSDLYSLGVVMYEMVTGKVPFDADTPVSVALKHMQEEAIPPILLNPNIPHSINDIIMKAMQKDVNKRYSNATEMLKDLNMALKNPEGNFVILPISNRSSKDEESTESVENKKGKSDKKPSKFVKIKKYFQNHPVVKILAIILLCITVFSLTMGGTYLALSLGKGKDVQIPDLVNLTLEEANKKATESKLKVEVSEEKYHLEIEEGKIIEQNPTYRSNYKVKEGSTIKVIVSKGQEIIKVTKVIGKKKDEAIKELKELGLEVTVVEDFSDDIEKDVVIKQDIEENKEIPAGTTITITVSKGIEQVQVPDLAGKTESEAKSALNEAKLKWKSTTKVTDSSKPNGVVVNQDISAESMVDKDTEVTITINEFNEIKTGNIYVNISAITNYKEKKDSEGNLIDPGTVKITVTVDGEERHRGNNFPRNSEKQSFEIYGTGTVTVKVYLEWGDESTSKTVSMNLNSESSKTID